MKGYLSSQHGILLIKSMTDIIAAIPEERFDVRCKAEVVLEVLLTAFAADVAVEVREAVNA